MAKKISSVLGIDIGSHSIKVCEVKANGKGATVSAIAVVPTPNQTVDQMGIFDGDGSLAAKVKEAITVSGASSSHAVVSIAGQQSVVVKVFDVDSAGVNTDAEFASLVNWEMSKAVSFAESDASTDYKKFPNADPSSTKTRVVAASSPPSALSGLVDCFKKSGKKLYAIDVQPLGLARTISMNHQAEGGVCVVDLGHITTTINVYQGGELVYPRVLEGIGKKLSDLIAHQKGIGESEAETFKHESFAIPAGEQAGTAFDPFAMGGATQAFTSDFSMGGYQAASASDYNPVADATVGMAAATPSVNDDLAIDPITGLPIESSVVDAVTSYTNDPFASADAASSPDPGVTGGFDPMATTSFDPFGASAPDAAYNPAMPQSVANDPVFDSTRYLFEDLVSDLRGTIDFISSSGGAVGKILLCGGGSRITGLEGYIQRSLGVNTEILDSLSAVNLAPKKADMAYVNEHRHLLSLAVGNGLHIMFE